MLYCASINFNSIEYIAFDVYLVVCIHTAIYHFDDLVLSMISSNLSNSYLFSYLNSKIEYN